MGQLGEADVLVVGGGPAGIGAAIAASRAGADTLLVERYGFFGGVAAWGLGMPINQMRPEGRSRGAVHELIIKKLQEYGPDAVSVVDHFLVCNVEYLKVAVMDVLDLEGCRCLLHSRAVDAVVEDGRLAGVVLGTKNGLATVRAKAVVDATGDADVACFAGAETMVACGSDGPLSPMTLLLMIGNVDTAAARRFEASGELALMVRAMREKYPLLPESMGFCPGPFPLAGCLVINHAGTKRLGPLDATSPAQLTEAERYSRRQALQILHALREYAPLFKDAQLVTTGPQVGVRETRRVKGLYVLTEEDAKSGRRFEDAVAWRSGMLDIGFVRYEEMQVHDVPYRALVPQALDGLLVAGRCISATHVAASAGKSMGNCLATGHAAGLAAAMCAERGCRPRELDVRALQTALAGDGVHLGAAHLGAAHRN